MTVYQVTLRTLSPVHIGDGDELELGFDVAARGGRTYRLDLDAILAAKEERLARAGAGRYPPPGELLEEADFNHRDFFRYTLPGALRSKKTDARLRSFIKDVHDRPYIPGSSLKGALRTALAWTGWEEARLRLERSEIGSRRAWAGQRLERKLFGPDPNHDLLRALHVSDLHGPQAAGEGLAVVNAQVITPRDQGSPVELEALRGDVVFHGSLTIDETLFTPAAERELHFGDRRRWLDELAARAQKHSLARIRQLAEWYERAEGGEAVARFYRQLGEARVGPNAALLQLGWGAGWDSKTFWTHLQRDPQLFEALVRDFRLHKAPKGSPPRRPGDPFPRSKRAVVVVREGASRLAAPLGWVLVELSPKPAGG